VGESVQTPGTSGVDNSAAVGVQGCAQGGNRQWGPDAPTGHHLQWTHGDTVVIVGAQSEE
jgi:hypothetical protein